MKHKAALVGRVKAVVDGFGLKMTSRGRPTPVIAAEWTGPINAHCIFGWGGRQALIPVA